MDKKGQWHVNNSLVGMLACPCPAPGQHSLSRRLVKFHFQLFFGVRDSVLGAGGRYYGASSQRDRSL